jgi:hypothetical protein
MINKFLSHNWYLLSKDKKYWEIFPRGSLYIQDHIHKKNIWQKIRIKQRAKKYILDSWKTGTRVITSAGALSKKN